MAMKRGAVCGLLFLAVAGAAIACASSDAQPSEDVQDAATEASADASCAPPPGGPATCVASGGQVSADNCRCIHPDAGPDAPSDAAPE
jgi:hypothetical protein